jgi:hypothetical protein
MAYYAYPQTSLDNAQFLLSLLGSFWTNTYEGQDLVQGTVFARGQCDANAYRQFLELIASCSRYHIPIYHTSQWHFLAFKASDVNGADSVAQYAYNTGLVFAANQDLAYGVPQGSTCYAVPIPEGLADVPLVFNRITSPSLSLVKNVDYWVVPGAIVFRDNPFSNPLVPTQDLYDSGGNIVDQQAGLWLFRGKFDWDQVYQQFGYALGLRLASSEGYKELVNAILDVFTLGATASNLHAAWSAITGIPLTQANGEVVTLVDADAHSVIVATNQNMYQFPLGSNVIVAVGQTVNRGDPLVDTLQFYEFGQGNVPADLDCLAVGKGILANGYLDSLVFSNQAMPTTVTTDPNGLTRITFPVDGYPGDVEKFWDDVQARGVMYGATLAHLLDVRPNPIGEPEAASLPAAINPLGFLCQNLLRYHVVVVSVRADLLGPAALGMSAVPALRRIVPAEKAMVVVTNCSTADTIDPTQAGSATQPGYTEELTFYPCWPVVEAVDPASMVVENVRTYQIVGRCE